MRCYINALMPIDDGDQKGSNCNYQKCMSIAVPSIAKTQLYASRYEIASEAIIGISRLYLQTIMGSSVAFWWVTQAQ